jgi:carbonic anhydrase/acetyltransferase-like protein (isoleucine patch superfamily)
MTVREFEGHRPVLGKRVFVDPSAVVIGDVSIGDDTSIWPMTVVRGDMHRISIGERTSIQDGSVLHITHASNYNPNGYPLSIGSDVTVGHKALLHGCTIGNRILIGMGATVMDGAIVEDEVVVAAGCLVPPNRQLERGHLYIGSPARKSRSLSEQELSYFAYSAANYVKLKDQHIKALEQQAHP